ncbi:tetratricopeptide repeat protein [Streptomyces sp. NPDC001811]
MAAGPLSLSTALCAAIRIEPYLIRTIRLHIRPALDVGAESDVWYGPWAVHRGRQYMAFRQPVLGELRQWLVEELRTSAQDAPIRQVGAIVKDAHGCSSVLAVEEQITWAALVAEAGLSTQVPHRIDQLLQRTLRTAVEQPHRRDGLRRWFAQAWQRLPERAREASGALDLYELLVAPSRGHVIGSGFGPGPSLRVPDVVLPVRHDGNRLSFGDSTWPADGILVPDTQPRILHISHDRRSWSNAAEVRVPRGGTALCQADHVPMYVRTSRGLVYRVGAPGGSDFIDRPPARSADRTLLGSRVGEVDLEDSTRFGIAPPLDRLSEEGSPLRPAPRQADRFDDQLGQAIDTIVARHSSGLIAVLAPRGSGRTLSALHAMKSCVPHWWVWSPPLIDRNEAVLQALSDDGIGSHTVLWLDNLDACLTDERTGEALANALLGLLADPSRRPVLVLARLQDAEANGGRMGPAAMMVLRDAVMVRDDATAAAPNRAYIRPYPVSRFPERPPVLAGRRKELEQLLTALDRDDPTPRFIALTGITGIGKTAVALEAAHQAKARGWFKGGLLYVPLRGADEPLWRALMRAMGSHTEAAPDTSGASRLRTLCRAQLLLAGGPDRPVLLLLDDVSEKHVADAAAVVPDGFTVLCVSRSTIELPYCRDVVLGPLSEDATTQLVQWLAEQGAPLPHPLARQDMTRVAQACDGHPLAVVLALAWLARGTGRSPTDLVGKLRSEVILDLADRTGASLRSRFNGVVSDLGRQQLKLFCLLSLLPGRSFSAHTLRTILPQVGDVESTLASLTRNHLIQRAARADQWEFHSLVQVYGRTLAHQVLTAREMQIARRRILEFFRTRAATANRLLYGQQSNSAKGDADDQRAALTWLKNERVSLVALASEVFDQEERNDAAAIALDIAQFLYSQQQFGPLLALMERVYDWADAAGDSEAKATALNNLAVSSAALGDFQKARTALLRAAALPYAQRQRADYLLMLSNLGGVLLRSQQATEAIELLTDAISQHDRNQPAALFSLLCNLGAALHQTGDIPQARLTLEQAEQLMSQYVISPADRAALFRNLAEVVKDSGDIRRAVACYLQALDSLEVLGQQDGQAAVHKEVARLYGESDQADRAIQHLAQARGLYRTLGDTAAEADSCSALGSLHLANGNLHHALESVIEARNLYQLSHNEREAALALHNIGNILLRLRLYSEAIPALRNATAHLEALGELHGQAQALHKLGRALQETDEPLQAVRCLTQSASLYQGLGRGRDGLSDEMRSLRDDLLTLSHFLTGEGQDAAANDALAAAVDLPRSL